MIRIDHLFKIFILTFSQIFCQNFNPETGQKIEPTFDPKTGIFLKSDSLQNINGPLNVKINFEQEYYKRTIYQKAGFWSIYYIENGKKISRKDLLDRLEIYEETRTIHEALKRNKLFLFTSGIMIITSPFTGLLFESPALGVLQFYGGLLFSVKSALNEANLLQKGIWIFNRETIKEYFQRKRKK